MAFAALDSAGHASVDNDNENSVPESWKPYHYAIDFRLAKSTAQLPGQIVLFLPEPEFHPPQSSHLDNA
jgi:hypothetical protein